MLTQSQFISPSIYCPSGYCWIVIDTTDFSASLHEQFFVFPFQYASVVYNFFKIMDMLIITAVYCLKHILLISYRIRMMRATIKNRPITVEHVEITRIWVFPKPPVDILNKVILLITPKHANEDFVRLIGIQW